MPNKAAQQEFIPSGGARVKIDYYVPDPNNPSRPIRATVPTESVDWLLQQLEKQGSGLDQLMQQEQGVQADLARMLLDQSQPQPQDVGAGETEVPQAPQGVMQ